MIQSSRRLGGEIALLREKVQLIDEHTNTYFQTLTEAGFPHLQEILRSLLIAYATIEKLSESGRKKEASLLTAWIADQSSPPPQTATLAPALQQTLQDWQETSQKLLLMCTDSLAQTSEQNASVGLERSRKRLPTSMSLERLRKWGGDPQ